MEGTSIHARCLTTTNSRDHVIPTHGDVRAGGDRNATYVRHGSQPTMVRLALQPDHPDERIRLECRYN